MGHPFLKIPRSKIGGSAPRTLMYVGTEEAVKGVSWPALQYLRARLCIQYGFVSVHVAPAMCDKLLSSNTCKHGVITGDGLEGGLSPGLTVCGVRGVGGTPNDML